MCKFSEKKKYVDKKVRTNLLDWKENHEDHKLQLRLAWERNVTFEKKQTRFQGYALLFQHVSQFNTNKYNYFSVTHVV